MVVSRLDRLACSTLHLCQIADLLKRKQVALHVLDQNLDTSNPTGRLLFNMLGAIAEFETEIRPERQLDGIHKAKELGIRFGRKQLLSASQIVELHLRRAQGTLTKILMKDFSPHSASLSDRKIIKTKPLDHSDCILNRIRLLRICDQSPKRD